MFVLKLILKQNILKAIIYETYKTFLTKINRKFYPLIIRSVGSTALQKNPSISGKKIDMKNIKSFFFLFPNLRLSLNVSLSSAKSLSKDAVSKHGIQTTTKLSFCIFPFSPKRNPIRNYLFWIKFNDKWKRSVVIEIQLNDE